MMIHVDTMGHQDIKMATAVNTKPFTVAPPFSLLPSVKRFDEAMALHQSPGYLPDTTEVTPVEPIEKISELALMMQRSMLRQLILYGVKPETDEE